MTKSISIGQGAVTLLDDADYERFVGKPVGIRARPRNTPCAILGGRQLHRIILDAEPGQHVDHINGDGLDNRRANLRLCTVEENNKNRRLFSTSTTGFKGVTLRPSGRYLVQIACDGTRYRLGRYDDAREAARVYDDAARRLHGSFAKTNAAMGLL